MRRTDYTGGEYPIERFWYSKAARFSSIEELIDKDPQYFIWAVETFQDVTPKQAEHFKEVYGMELPKWCIAPADCPPYTHPRGAPLDDPEYEKLCEEYDAKYRDYFKQKVQEETGGYIPKSSYSDVFRGRD